MEFVHALDLSLSNTGYSIFDVEGKLIKTGSIYTDIKKKHGQRLEIIHDALTFLRNKYPTKMLILERGFCKFNKATLALGEVKGVCLLVYADCDVEEYSPSSIKKIITGNGKGSKEEVASIIQKKYPFIEFENYDATDSAAAGLCHFIKNKIENKMEIS